MHAPDSFHTGNSALAGSLSPAILLTSQSDFKQHQSLIKLLNFFGIPWKTETATDLLQRLLHGEQTPVRLFSRPDGFAELLDRIQGDVASLLRAQIHSVFIYGLTGSISCSEPGKVTVEAEVKGEPSQIEIATGHKLSGIMAGLGFLTKDNGDAKSIAILKVVEGQDGDVLPIVSTDLGPFFVEISYQDIPVFVTTTEDLIELDTELATGVFDIREHAAATLPIVLYLKWAFAETCWRAPSSNACLVIDDPLLKPRHGFVEVQRATRRDAAT